MLRDPTICLRRSEASFIPNWLSFTRNLRYSVRKSEILSPLTRIGSRMSADMLSSSSNLDVIINELRTNGYLSRRLRRMLSRVSFDSSEK